MTRENKVALVVGFALVLFVGILISDHFSRARARPADLIPAGLEQAQQSPQLLDVRRDAPQPAPALPAAPAAAVAQEPQPGPPQSQAPPPPASPTPAAPPAATPPQLQLHEVRPGESLSSICQQYYGDQRFIEKLAAYNGINDPDNIWGGVRLRVPSLEVLAPGAPALASPASAKPARYQVQEGDTLCSIAQRLMHSRTRWKQLYEVNREVISDPDNIRPGSVLRIPAG